MAVRSRPGGGTSRPADARFARSFAIAAYLLFALFFYRLSVAESGVTVLAGFILLLASLLPTACWIGGVVKGLPVFPLFAVTFSWTYALPLIVESARVMRFSEESRLSVGMLISAFLLAGSAAWFVTGQRAAAVPDSMRMLSPRRGLRALIAAVALNGALNAAMQAGIRTFIPPGYESLVRAVLLGLTVIAAFVLPYLAGADRLSRPARWASWTVLVWSALSGLVGLVMIGALSLVALAILGYTLGRRHFPVLQFALLLGAASVLHAGKSEMRDRYWRSGNGSSLRPLDYPGFLMEWGAAGLGTIAARNAEPSAANGESFAERSELAHMLLRIRAAEAGGTPRLDGVTYGIIPLLLVPRVVSPEKLRSHEGSYLLSIHYGVQTRQDTYRTTIAWGLASEAYANFGSWGLLALGVVIGGVTGALARWTRHAPPLSLRFLFAVICLGYAFQAEFTAGVLVTALFQSGMGLLAFGALFARRTPLTVTAGASR